MINWIAIPPWARRPPFTLPASTMGLLVAVLSALGLGLLVLLAVLFLLIFAIARTPCQNCNGSTLFEVGLLIGLGFALPGIGGLVGGYLMYRQRPIGQVIVSVAILTSLLATAVGLARGDGTPPTVIPLLVGLIVAHYLIAVTRFHSSEPSSGQRSGH